MKARTWIILLVMLLAIVALLFYRRPIKTTPPVDTNSKQIQSGVISTASNVQASGTPAFSANQVRHSNPPIANDGNANPDQIRRVLESQNTPIEFIGRVVDQDNNPLSGVAVSANVRHWVVKSPTAFGSE